MSCCKILGISNTRRLDWGEANLGSLEPDWVRKLGEFPLENQNIQDFIDREVIRFNDLPKRKSLLMGSQPKNKLDAGRVAILSKSSSASDIPKKPV